MTKRIPLELRAIARAEKTLQLGRGFADEKTIELLDLATFALPSDPALLALAPQTSAMEKEEAPRAMPLVQLLDPADRDVEILRILRHDLLGGIGKIAQERKAQVRIGIAEVANFQAVHFVFDRRRGGQHHRHHHECAAIIRDAFLFEGHFRQHPRPQDRGHEIVHRQHRQFAGGHNEKEAEQSEHWSMD